MQRLPSTLYVTNNTMICRSNHFLKKIRLSDKSKCTLFSALYQIGILYIGEASLLKNII